MNDLYPVTTITPCHNSAATLGECWDSIKEQTIGMENMQVIFVDDASDDDGETAYVLNEIRYEYPERITVITLPENRRQGGARNEALKYVKGKYIQFLDSDDTLRTDALKSLFMMAEEYQADLIQYADNRFNGDRLFCVSNTDDRKRFLSSGYYWCGHQMKFYKRDLLFRANSHFAEHKVYEEPLFTYPLAFYLERMLSVKENYYNYRPGSASTMHSVARGRFMDHPLVQLELLDEMSSREGILDTYHDEIEEYFIFTFFYETVHNMRALGILNESVNDLLWLKTVVLERFPGWEDNPYIKEYNREWLDVLDLLK